MIISIDFTDDERRIAEEYAKLHNANLSDLIKDAFFEKIEDEYDVKLSDQVMKDSSKDTYSLDEMKKLLGL